MDSDSDWARLPALALIEVFKDLGQTDFLNSMDACQDWAVMGEDSRVWANRTVVVVPGDKCHHLARHVRLAHGARKGWAEWILNTLPERVQTIALDGLTQLTCSGLIRLPACLTSFKVEYGDMITTKGLNNLGKLLTCGADLRTIVMWSSGVQRFEEEDLGQFVSSLPDSVEEIDIRYWVAPQAITRLPTNLSRLTIWVSSPRDDEKLACDRVTLDALNLFTPYMSEAGQAHLRESFEVTPSRQERRKSI